MIERLLIVFVLAGVGVLAYRLFRAWEVRRAGRLAPTDPLLVAARSGVPTILYFTTPMCAPCKLQQRPAIKALLDEMGDRVQVIEVDAAAEPDAASRWGVISVPTTFILDSTGRPRQVNHGVAGIDTLKHQIQAI